MGSFMLHSKSRLPLILDKLSKYRGVTLTMPLIIYQSKSLQLLRMAKSRLFKGAQSDLNGFYSGRVLYERDIKD